MAQPSRQAAMRARLLAETWLDKRSRQLTEAMQSGRNIKLEIDRKLKAFNKCYQKVVESHVMVTASIELKEIPEVVESMAEYLEAKDFVCIKAILLSEKLGSLQKVEVQEEDRVIQISATRGPVDMETETVRDLPVSKHSKPCCVLCSGAHWPRRCPRYNDATTDKRYRMAGEHKLCYRCLREGHGRGNCTMICFHCKSDEHHGTLC